MNVLFISSFNHFLIDDLRRNLQVAGIESCALFIDRLQEKAGLPRLLVKSRRAFNFIKIFFHIVFFGHRYDVVSYHYATKHTKYLAWVAKMYVQRQVLTIWGSEWLAATPSTKAALYKLYDAMDAVSSTNSAIIDSLKLTTRKFAMPFGLSQLDRMRDIVVSETRETSCQKIGLDGKKKHIVIGTNASKNQQHQKIIDELSGLNEADLRDFSFVFPLTYGDLRYKSEVKRYAKSLKTDVVFLTDQLTSEDVARLRIASDVLIQVQITDQLSGAMLETLGSGGTVVTGSWLPYEVLERKGIRIIKINELSELKATIKSILSISEPASKNENIKIVELNYGWPGLIGIWAEFLRG